MGWIYPAVLPRDCDFMLSQKWVIGGIIASVIHYNVGLMGLLSWDSSFEL
jgi:hypothetical protein